MNLLESKDTTHTKYSKDGKKFFSDMEKCDLLQQIYTDEFKTIEKAENNFNNKHRSTLIDI